MSDQELSQERSQNPSCRLLQRVWGADELVSDVISNVDVIWTINEACTSAVLWCLECICFNCLCGSSLVVSIGSYKTVELIQVPIGLVASVGNSLCSNSVCHGKFVWDQFCCQWYPTVSYTISRTVVQLYVLQMLAFCPTYCDALGGLRRGVYSSNLIILALAIFENKDMLVACAEHTYCQWCFDVRYTLNTHIRLG